MGLFGGGGSSQETESESRTKYTYDPAAKGSAYKVKKYANRVIRPEVESYYQKYKEGMSPEAMQWWQKVSDIYKKGGPESLQQAHSATMNVAQQLSADPLYFMNQGGWSDVIDSIRRRQAMEPELQARELEGQLGASIGAMGLGKREYAEAALQSQATREAEMSNILAQRLEAERQAKQYGFEALPRAWASAEAFDPEGAARAKEQLMWQNLPMEAQGAVLNDYINRILQGFMGPTLNVSSLLFSHPDEIYQWMKSETEGGGGGGGFGGIGSLLGGLAGSIIPGVGTAIGGLAGGALGSLFG